MRNLSTPPPQKKKFVSPVLGRKSLNNAGFKERQIIRLPVASTRLGPGRAGPGRPWT